MIVVEDYVYEVSREERRAHLKLDEPCIERGGDSRNHRGILVAFLDTNFPTGKKICLCHGCHNGRCSNPRHLYWGTNGDNMIDAYESNARPRKPGTFAVHRSSKGLIWINDGIKRRQLDPTLPIPDGFRKGYKLGE